MNTPSTFTLSAGFELPLVLPAEVTHAQARGTLALLNQAVQAQTEGAVVVDGSQLQRFDSSVLAVILSCRRAVLAQGRTFSVCNLPAHLTELGQLYGVQDLLHAGSADMSSATAN